ncbi:MAG: hypothetical protein R2856_07795 [Caldilineaceae bacterium]
MTPQSIYGFFQNGGTMYVVSLRTLPPAQAPLLNANGESPLLVKFPQIGLTA